MAFLQIVRFAQPFVGTFKAIAVVVNCRRPNFVHVIAFHFGESMLRRLLLIVLYRMQHLHRQ